MSTMMTVLTILSGSVNVILVDIASTICYVFGAMIGRTQGGRFERDTIPGTRYGC